MDRLQRIEDGLARAWKPVAPHPLDLTDPHGYAGQFGRVGVQFDPLHVGGADRGEGALESHRLGFQLYPVLQIVEGVERQVEEVAGAAGGIEDGELPKPLEERAERVLGLFAVPRRRSP